MSTTNQSPYNATVIGREEIHADLIILRVRPDAALFDFKPGQFGVLGLTGSAPRIPEAAAEEPVTEPDKMIRRAYSIASSSVERRYIEFYLTLISSGQLTPRLFALKYGDRVFLGPKASGMFTLDRVAPDKSVVLIATGTGLAPYVSMLRTLLMTETERKFVILHGARYSWDLGYRGELESLARLRPNFTYIPSITRADQDPHFMAAPAASRLCSNRARLKKIPAWNSTRPRPTYSSAAIRKWSRSSRNCWPRKVLPPATAKIPAPSTSKNIGESTGAEISAKVIFRCSGGL